jgi:hypothetical protein
VGDSPSLLVEGNSRNSPLVVKTKVFNNAVSVWKVSGTIENSLSVKGVRSRMYRNASSQLGYYEQDQPAFYYDESGKALNFNVLFKTEENALRFQNLVIDESITFQSPMNSLRISAEVTDGTFQLASRILTTHYSPTESESPQETPSGTSVPLSTVEETSDLFKYQRIEKLLVFGSLGKADSCHLMSSAHCRKYLQSYGQLDNDQNNRLAMSKELHGWFDKMSSAIPLFYLKVVSISEAPVLDGRYKVILAVVVVDQESANMIFWRLIEGSTTTDDPLVMHTFVHVMKPDVFQRCLLWKEKEILKDWQIYFSMYSAVP